MSDPIFNVFLETFREFIDNPHEPGRYEALREAARAWSLPGAKVFAVKRMNLGVTQVRSWPFFGETFSSYERAVAYMGQRPWDNTTQSRAYDIQECEIDSTRRVHG